MKLELINLDWIVNNLIVHNLLGSVDNKVSSHLTAIWPLVGGWA